MAGLANKWTKGAERLGFVHAPKCLNEVIVGTCLASACSLGFMNEFTSHVHWLEFQALVPSAGSEGATRKFITYALSYQIQFLVRETVKLPLGLS